ncbi:unnamed protein product [Adineta ricciae]|uniref:G-protein coupled receptors family 1 profile domain-containing protein n=1 Tax=Adineta ricciae TaxID=249248 RepID=A0A816EYQ7_ADIRI|nr:unnamed protein product [Adineta ricciae]
MNITTSSTSTNLSYELGIIYTYISPIILIFTMIANIINIIVFSRGNLRSYSCSHYFLALAFASLIYMIVSPMILFLQYRFGISAITTSFGCRSMLFIIYSSSLLATLMLVCASIDRFFASSSSVRLRNLSNIRMAQILIIVITISVLIYISPFCIIYYWNFTTNRCTQLSSTIIIIYFTSRIIVYYILAPLVMGMFGLLTIHNIRSQIRRVSTINSRRHRRTESQLARMLIVQVTAYVFFSIPAAVTYILTTLVPSMNTSLINNIRSMTLLWQQGNYVFSTFVYILSGSIYREELKKIFILNYYQRRITD